MAGTTHDVQLLHLLHTPTAEVIGHHTPPTFYYIYARTREDVWMLRSTFYVIRQGKM